MSRSRLAVSLVCLVATGAPAGCTVEELDDEDLATTASESAIPNGHNLNGHNLNGHNPPPSVRTSMRPESPIRRPASPPSHFLPSATTSGESPRASRQSS
jgi:hypothetical protein